MSELALSMDSSVCAMHCGESNLNNASETLPWVVRVMYTKPNGEEIDGLPLIFKDETNASKAARDIIKAQTTDHGDEYEESHDDDRHLVLESTFSKDGYVLITVTVEQPDVIQTST